MARWRRKVTGPSVETVVLIVVGVKLFLATPEESPAPRARAAVAPVPVVASSPLPAPLATREARRIERLEHITRVGVVAPLDVSAQVSRVQRHAAPDDSCPLAAARAATRLPRATSPAARASRVRVVLHVRMTPEPGAPPTVSVVPVLAS